MSGPAALAIRSRRVLLPGGERPACLWIAEGTITAVRPWEDLPARAPLVDADQTPVLPGLVDTHVHVNEPGRAEWEGFETATDAAAAGGVTTLIDMPLNSRPATTTFAALKIKQAAARGRCRVDAGFWGGVVPGNVDELEPMAAAGAFGFKAFLIDSGIDDFRLVGEAELRSAMPVLARLGLPLLAHAELAWFSRGEEAAPRRYADFLASRPKAWENEAIRLLARLSRETGCAVHVVHLSSAEALPVLEEARRDGAAVTAETCPHYLTFAAEDIADGRTEFKCCPPIREAANREALWDGLSRGVIDLVVSDHSPCSPELKKLEQGDFTAAWGGISSLQLGLSAVWAQARRRGKTLSDVVRWMCAGPARLAGLSRKGRLAVGCDADLVVFDPDAAWRVTASQLRHRHKVTPYSGVELGGRVEAAYLGGRLVFEGGQLIGEPSGRLLERRERQPA